MIVQTRWKRFIPVAVSLAFMPGLALAAGADATAVLKKASEAMGADQLKSIQYSASGTLEAFGQSYKAGAAGPKINVVSQTRSINYETASMRDESVLTRVEKPARGGAAVPAVGEARPNQVVSGGYAWNQVGPNPVADPRSLDDRQHQLWTTPHGIIKAAMKSKATVQWQTRGGKSLAVVSFAEAGKFSAVAYINDDYLVEKIESRASNAVFGDMPVTTTFSSYIDFGGVKFPARIQQVQEGFPSDLKVTGVQLNAPVAISVPDAVTKSTTVASAQKAGDGIWFVAGGSHNSVAIEMKDHVVVVEGPLFDERANAVIAEVKKVIPGKPIRYVVNSHYHFDHSGGLRAFVAEGATIVTHAINKPFYERAYANPWKIAPDRMAKSKKKASFKTVNDKLVLSDGARTIEILHIKDNRHNDGMLMAWLPKERMLIEADAFTPGPPGAKPPAEPNVYSVNLADNIERLKLPVDQILPLHGRMVPLAELYTAIGRKQ